MCLFTLVKTKNDPIRTEGGVAFQRNLEFLHFPEIQVEFWKFWVCYSVGLYYLGSLGKYSEWSNKRAKLNLHGTYFN